MLVWPLRANRSIRKVTLFTGAGLGHGPVLTAAVPHESVPGKNPECTLYPQDSCVLKEFSADGLAFKIPFSLSVVTVTPMVLDLSCHEQGNWACSVHLRAAL